MIYLVIIYICERDCVPVIYSDNNWVGGYLLIDVWGVGRNLVADTTGVYNKTIVG